METVNIHALLNMSSLITIIVLCLILVMKMERIKQLQRLAEKLNRSLKEMDEQAKLIIRTDMELNKTQEELDKKVSGLYTLQKISRALSVTFDENKILKHLTRSDVEELGFEKCLIFMLRASEQLFSPVLLIGYSAQELQETFKTIGPGLLALIINEAKNISSISGDAPIQKERIRKLFNAEHFVISPILPPEGDKGFIFMGSSSPEIVITEGDEEIINVLANHIGQALENARLFDKTYQAQQTLEKKVEERTRELKKALEEIKGVNKRKSDFVSAVSHELRTPLTSIKGYASILLAERLGKIPKEVKERLEKINKHSDELTRMVNDLLDVSRIESGRVELKMQPQGLKEITDSVIDLLQPQLKDKRILISLDIPRGLPNAMADRSQVERVFINLLGNAIKFTPESGRIAVRANVKNEFIQIDISDNGIGIPETSLPFIFDEFYRVDNEINQSLKGTGLGLSLVKYIVNAHKGDIWVKSRLNEGTTFSFTLPITR
ncbi:MAG: ATP-binding protein [Candidatus Omnitrophica bacterium]|nr:ATP-binding protein [Candidatus Omnitrophota bacterium]